MCSIGYNWFSSGWFGWALPGSRTAAIVVWARTMKRVERDCQVWTRAKFARLSGVGNVCIGRDIPEFTASEGGLRTRMESSCSQEHPLLNQWGFFMFFSIF